MQIKIIFVLLASTLANALECIIRENLSDKVLFNYSDLSLINKVFEPLVLYKSINAANNEIKIIPSYTFANFCFNQIDLSNNEIENVSNNSFTGVLQLKDLILKRNRIESIGDLLDGLYFANLSTLDLSNNRIRYIDRIFPPIVTAMLQMDYNSIEYIRDFAFSKLTSLKTLRLRGNRLNRLRNLTLSNLQSLTILDVSHNQISEIESNTFDGLDSVYTLVINHNSLERLNSSTFGGLISLFSLYMDFNPVSYFEKGAIQSLSNLYELSMDKNNIDQSVLIDPLETLNYISLNYNPISTLRAFHFDGFNNLMYLSLAQCKIETIEENALANMRTLQMIFLGYNKISSLKNGVFRNLSKLLEINLSSNVISSIEAQVFQPMQAIETINIDHNLISTIPIGLFSNLTHLVHIKLSYNKIKVLKTGTFNSLKRLTELQLNENEIINIEIDAFQGLDSLFNLDLSDNKLRSIENYYFTGLFKLNQLVLKGNGINSIRKNSFRDLTQIQLIDLSDNFIMSIETSSFIGSNHPNLSVDLSRNQLDAIDLSMFTDSKISLLNMTSNNLKSLEKNSLCYLFMTKRLNFGFNQLTFISDQLFGNSSSQAKILLLNNNRLSNLEFLSQFINLYELDVSNNLIEKLTLNEFKGLVSLVSLNIGYNRIRFIEDRFFDVLGLESINLTNITHPVDLNLSSVLKIDLSCNLNARIRLGNYSNLIQLVLVNIDANFSILDFSLMSSLSNLDLSENRDDGKFSLDGLQSLEYLKLSKMGIEIINERFSFDQFPALKYLNLSHNSLGFVRKQDFYNINRLSILDLSNNNISWIEYGSFERISNLARFYLENNQIRAFTLSVYFTELLEFNLRNNVFLEMFNPNLEGEHFLRELRVLDLSKNSLKLFQASVILPEYNYFSSLNLGENLLDSITYDLLSDMKDLKTLILDSNRISSVDWSSFLDLDQLEYLSLANNSIGFLDQRTFSNLLQLGYLNLSYNHIESISRFLFAKSYNLKILDLSYNRLKSIEDFSFVELSLLQDFHLNNNRLEFVLFENSLFGLSSLVNLFITYEFISNSENKQVLLGSLKPHVERFVNGITYYKAINMLYEINEMFQHDECQIVLDFLKRNIQVNLKSDYDLLVFLYNCEKLSL